MDKQAQLQKAFNQLRYLGLVKTQGDFANLLGVNRTTLSCALKGDTRYLTESLMNKVNLVLEGKSSVPTEWVQSFPAVDGVPANDRPDVIMLPVIPVEAMAGTLGEFSSRVEDYDCERMISPIKGADFAIKVSGESMAPEYPNGSQVLIKRVNEHAFLEWGKVYVLDTDNGPVIKRLRKTENDDEIECVSINPEYQAFRVQTQYIRGYYRVLAVLATK